MRFILGLFVIAFSVPAHADWHVAESDNFVIYADDQAKDLQAFGEALESYNAALNLLSKREATKPSPANHIRRQQSERNREACGRQVKDDRRILYSARRFIRRVRAGHSHARTRNRLVDDRPAA